MENHNHQFEYEFYGYLSSLIDSVANYRHAQNEQRSGYGVNVEHEIEFFDFMASSIIDNQALWTYDYPIKEDDWLNNGIPNGLMKTRISDLFADLVLLNGTAPILLMDLITRLPYKHIVSCNMIIGLNSMVDPGRGFYLPLKSDIESRYLEILESDVFNNSRPPILISERGYIDNDDYLKTYINAVKNHIQHNPEENLVDYIGIDQILPNEVIFSNHVNLSTFKALVSVLDGIERTEEQKRERVSTNANFLLRPLPNTEIGLNRAINKLAGDTHPLAKENPDEPNIYGRSLLDKTFFMFEHTHQQCRKNSFTNAGDFFDNPAPLFTATICQLFEKNFSKLGADMTPNFIVYALAMLNDAGYDLNLPDKSGQSIMDVVRYKLATITSSTVISYVEHEAFRLSNPIKTSDNNQAENPMDTFSI